MNEPWVVNLIGGLSLCQGNAETTRFRTHKTGALLAYLSYFRDRSHAREVLIDLLWPDLEMEAGRNSLSVALSSLRGQLEGPATPSGAAIIADRASVRANPNAVTTDVARFNDFLRRADGAPTPTERAVHTKSAIALYRGPLLPGYYEEWISAEQRHIEERYFAALCWLIEYTAQAGHHAGAVEYAHRGLTIDPERDDVLTLLDRLTAAPPTKTKRGAPAPAGQAIPEIMPLPAPRPLPSGTVTVLAAAFDALARGASEEHASAAAPLDRAIRAHGGHVVSRRAELTFAVFDCAIDALSAAVDAQKALSQGSDAANARMALDTGDVTASAADREGSEYTSLTERLSAIVVAAHPGQIVCTDASASIVRQDLTPDIRLQDLGTYRFLNYAGRIYMPVSSELSRDFPRLKAPFTQTPVLPVAASRFIGRLPEVEELTRMLQNPSNRLITLFGPGGVGKTSLAIEVTRRLVDTFGGRVYFVPLADRDSAESASLAMLTTLRLTPTTGRDPIEDVGEALSSERSLLVLDNCEQMVEAVAGLVQTLLERAPSLVVLVTSQRLLGLSMEAECLLMPLPTPLRWAVFEQIARSEAVQLFLDRARRVRPDFRLTPATADAIAAICVELEGMPLALELAAARVSVLTARQMLEQLGNKFTILSGGKRDKPERHRTMRSAIAWSYGLLSPDLQAVLRRLSIFRGGFTMDAAAGVCETADIFESLWELRQCSLIYTDESPDGLRFRILETVRSYAEELAAQQDDVADHRERHWRYFYDLANEARSELEGPASTEWLDRLDREQENLRLALSYKTTGDRRLFLCSSLHRFWLIRGYVHEGRRFLHEALEECADADPLWRAVAQNACGNLEWTAGNLETAETLMRDALAYFGDAPSPDDQAGVLNNLGLVLAHQGNYEEAYGRFQESLAIHEAGQNTLSAAVVISNMARIEQVLGDYEASERHLDEAIPELERGGIRLALAHALRNVGHLMLMRDDVETANDFFTKSFLIRRELGNRTYYPMALYDAALIKERRGELEFAASLIYAAERIRAGTNVPDFPDETTRCVNLRTSITGAIGLPRMAELEAQLAAFSPNELLSLAASTSPLCVISS